MSTTTDTINTASAMPHHVTPEPRHLYTAGFGDLVTTPAGAKSGMTMCINEPDDWNPGDPAALYYVASDGSAWTIDEDTGETAPAILPSFVDSADLGDRPQGWDDCAEWDAHELLVEKARERIEGETIGFAAVVGDATWGAVVVAGDRGRIIKADTSANGLAIHPATRRFLAAFKADPSVDFDITPSGIVDLTDDALDGFYQF